MLLHPVEAAAQQASRLRQIEDTARRATTFAATRVGSEVGAAMRELWDERTRFVRTAAPEIRDNYLTAFDRGWWAGTIRHHRSALGAAAQVAQPRDVAFPFGTLAVNLIACLLIGVIAEFALATGRLSPEARVLLTSGFCGGFSTFSTFSYESIELFQAGAWSRALLYVAVSVVLGLGAVLAGAAIVRAAVGAPAPT